MAARLGVAALLLLLGTAGVWAQQPRGAAAEDEIKVYARRLKYQSANEALPLVEPLLSERGTVELHTAFNLLVFRDSAEALRRIQEVVLDFDHPRRQIQVDIVVLDSGPAQEFEALGDAEALPEWLENGLGQLVKMPEYRNLARARMSALEGQDVEYELGGGFRVRFEAGTVVQNRRLHLRHFEVTRGADRRRLFLGELSLQLDKPFVLGFARDESSGVQLAVALTCSQEEAAQALVPTGGGR